MARRSYQIHFCGGAGGRTGSCACGGDGCAGGACTRAAGGCA